ncbi:MAG TPA: DMT family transporter [Candidatus Methylomirabilis sp.]|nr:DMT family transporter [Candidatus Methylomirabilis sp.]HSB77932.1 DMT family transporter [Candidatus Methylomirabilis sp.]
MKEARAVITVLVGATLLGSLGAWGRMVYRYEGDPLTVVTWRALIGTAVLSGLLAALRPELLRLRSRDLPFFALYGFIGVTLNFWTYFSAVKYTTLAIAITLLYTYPAFVALLSAVFLGERLTATKLGAIFLTLLGSALVAQVYATDLLRVNLRGILFGLMTGLSMATYSIFGKRAMSRYPPWTVVLYAFAAGSAFLALGTGSRLLAAIYYPAAAWLWIVGLALIPSLGGYALYTLGLRDLPASRASIIATWEVVTAALLGWLLFREALVAPQLVGAALVCFGIWWIQRSEG